MLDLVIDRLGDAHFMAFLLAALGCAATALTVVVPMLQTDNLSRRIRAVSDERERIRQRERERLAAKDNRTQLRSRPSSMLKRLVDTLNLTSWLSTETAKEQLAKAGFRGAGAEYAFVAGRLIAPISFAIIAAVYIFGIADWQQPLAIKLGGVMAAVYLGVKAPEIYLRNATTQTPEVDRARLSQHARPDADLRRIGHVDRARGAQGERRNRRRKRRNGRRADAALG